MLIFHGVVSLRGFLSFTQTAEPFGFAPINHATADSGGERGEKWSTQSPLWAGEAEGSGLNTTFKNL